MEPTRQSASRRGTIDCLSSRCREDELYQLECPLLTIQQYHTVVVTVSQQEYLYLWSTWYRHWLIRTTKAQVYTAYIELYHVKYNTWYKYMLRSSRQRRQNHLRTAKLTTLIFIGCTVRQYTKYNSLLVASIAIILLHYHQHPTLPLATLAYHTCCRRLSASCPFNPFNRPSAPLPEFVRILLGNSFSPDCRVTAFPLSC